MKKHFSPERLIANFWKRVDKNANQYGCWIWRGATFNTGYGHTRDIGRKQITAHRYAYQLIHGEIPKGLVICHSCDNPLCVCPNHLFAATQKANIRDAMSKGRLARQGARLNADLAAAMRRDRANGAKHFDLAEKYKVTPMTVRRILGNVSYASNVV